MSKLICYTLGDPAFTIKPAQRERGWMERTRDRFAYRCLPLVIANAFGWTVCTTRGFDAWWEGSEASAGLHIVPHSGKQPATSRHGLPVSHFGNGVLTFHIQALFRTEPGIQLWAGGPINHVKDAIQPLTGIVETDWLPFTFTMNWIFTRADTTVRFDKGEPIAHFFPVRRSTLERVDPEIRPLHEDADRKTQNDLWRESRANFLGGLNARDAETVKEKWQKAYYRGMRPDGKAGTKDHQIKLRLSEFARPTKRG